MKNALLLALSLACSACLAQGDLKQVSVKANGTDVREVLFQLFTQSGKNYVLEPGNHFALNLNLDKIEFEEALQIVCHAAGLKADLQNGIYYVDKEKPKRADVHATAFQSMVNPIKQTSSQFLPPSALAKRVTMRLHKVPLKSVLAELARQSHLKFELDPAVPVLKLDAVLSGVTIRSALDQITEAAGLSYSLTDRQSIVVKAGKKELL